MLIKLRKKITARLWRIFNPSYMEMLEFVLAENYDGLRALIEARWQSFDRGDIRTALGSALQSARPSSHLEVLYQYARHFENLEAAWRVREAFLNALRAERLSGSRLRRDHICQALEDSDVEFFNNWKTVARLSITAMPTFLKSLRLLRRFLSERGTDPASFQFRRRGRPRAAVIEGPAIGNKPAEARSQDERVRVVFNDYSAHQIRFGLKTIVFFADDVAERFVPQIRHVSKQFHKTIIKSPEFFSTIRIGLPPKIRKKVELIKNADDLLLANFYGPFALLGAVYHLFASGFDKIHIRNVTFYALENLDYSSDYGPDYDSAPNNEEKVLLRLFRLHDPLGNFAFFKMLQRNRAITFCPTGEMVIGMTGEEYAKRLDARIRNHDVPAL